MANLFVDMPHPSNMPFTFEDNHDSLPALEELRRLVEDAQMSYSYSRTAHESEDVEDIASAEAFVNGVLSNSDNDEDSFSSQPQSVVSSCSSLENVVSVPLPLPIPFYSAAQVRMNLINTKRNCLEPLVPRENLVIVVNVIDVGSEFSHTPKSFAIEVARLTQDLLEDILRFDRQERPAYSEDMVNISRHFTCVLQDGCLEPHMMALDFANLYYYSGSNQ